MIQFKPYFLDGTENEALKSFITAHVEAKILTPVPPNKQVCLSPIFVVRNKNKLRIVVTDLCKITPEVIKKLPVHIPSFKELPLYINNKRVYT